MDPMLSDELIALVDQRFEELRRAALPVTAYGIVAAVDPASSRATVYVSGDAVASGGFAYARRPMVGSYVRVVVHPNGDRYIEDAYPRAPAERLNVRDFGAIGDGVADDTAAIQAAIDVCAARVPQGGEVFLPAGRYKIIAKLVMHSGVYLVGEGNRATIINQVTLAEHAIEVLGASAVSTKVQLGVRDLGIVGPGKTSGGTGSGLRVKWASYGLVFENLWINGFGSHGASVEDSYTASWRDVQFDGNGGDGFRGLTNINNTEFSRCVSILNAGRGYYVEGGASVTMIACDAESNTGAGIDLRYVTTGSLVSCHMEKNGLDGASPNVYLHFKTSLSDKAQSVTIAGCLIQGQSVTVDGILVDGSERAVIVGNWLGNHVNNHIRTTANATRTTIGPNQTSGTGTYLTDASGSTWAQHHGPVKTVTIDPASIPANSTANQFVSLPTAAVGDAVAIGPPAGLETGLVVTGYVSAADIVQIRIANVTAAAINPASGSWRVAVLRSG